MNWIHFLTVWFAQPPLVLNVKHYLNIHIGETGEKINSKSGKNMYKYYLQWNVDNRLLRLQKYFVEISVKSRDLRTLKISFLLHPIWVPIWWAASHSLSYRYNGQHVIFTFVFKFMVTHRTLLLFKYNSIRTYDMCWYTSYTREIE